MSAFERYHPILTAHYQLDWLTAYPLNAVADWWEARQIESPEDINATAAFVNRTMSDIMSDRRLVWGVGTKKGQFLGSAGLSHFEVETAELFLFPSPTPEAREAALEVGEHLMQFALEEFHIKTLTAYPPADNDQEQTLYDKLGFVRDGSTRPDGTASYSVTLKETED